MEFNIEKYRLKSSLFHILSEEELLFIKKNSTRKEYQKGEVIYTENALPKGIFIVKKGKVKIFQTNKEGKESIVYLYKKGDYFGYRQLLANELNPVSAAAVDNVVVSFITKETFLELVSQSPALERELLTHLSQEFSVWVNKMTIFSNYSVKERVALTLLILDHIYDHSKNGNGKHLNGDEKHVNGNGKHVNGNGKHVNGNGNGNGHAHIQRKVSTISINRDDLAGFVGSARETLVRILKVFKNEGIITSKGTKIKLIKPEALTEIL